MNRKNAKEVGKVLRQQLLRLLYLLTKKPHKKLPDLSANKVYKVLAKKNLLIHSFLKGRDGESNFLFFSHQSLILHTENLIFGLSSIFHFTTSM